MKEFLDKTDRLSKEEVSAFLLSRGLSPYMNQFGEMKDVLTPEQVKWITQNFIIEKPLPEVILPISNFRDEQRSLLLLIQGEINRLSKLKDELGQVKVMALNNLYAKVATSFQNDMMQTISNWKEESIPQNNLFLTNLGVLHQTNIKGLSIFSQSSDSSEFLQNLDSYLEKMIITSSKK